MEVITSVGFVSNFSLILLISIFIEFLDKGKTFGGIFCKHFLGIRGATFGTWMILCGILATISFGLSQESIGVFVGVVAFLIGLGTLLIVDIYRRVLFVIERTNEKAYVARKLDTNFEGDNVIGKFANPKAAKIVRDVAAQFTDFDVLDEIEDRRTRKILFFKNKASMEKCIKQIAQALREKRLSFYINPTVRIEDEVAYCEAFKMYPFGFYIIC